MPLATPDGRGLVAIGCAEGVWIGLRHDPKCELHFIATVTTIYLDSRGSYAASPALEDGNSVCHARGLWYFPCPRRQGKIAKWTS